MRNKICHPAVCLDWSGTKCMESFQLTAQTEAFPDSNCCGYQSVVSQGTTDIGSTIRSLIKFLPVCQPLHSKSTHSSSLSSEVISKDEPYFKSALKARTVLKLLMAVRDSLPDICRQRPIIFIIWFHNNSNSNPNCWTRSHPSVCFCSFMKIGWLLFLLSFCSSLRESTDAEFRSTSWIQNLIYTDEEKELAWNI